MDGVTIGPNVCIIGDITVGKGAVIGAGSVVVKDVTENILVVGNPAKVIGMKNKININPENVAIGGGGKIIDLPFTMPTFSIVA